MRIKEIEIDNFKTFGRPTKISFLSGFTAISGPNGSGKSNIIDSVLFCLGLSNSRTMRAEKLTDLINNASDRREARVTIRFGDDEDGTIEVARRIREGESGYQSTYYLNGRSCTLSELHDTLARHNVSPSGYNVVMQGDVARVITMSATERRKIIDEVAGVAEFDSRVQQAQRELEKVNEQEDKAALILAEIAERLLSLQAQRDHALKYKDLRDERDRLEALSKLSACWDLRQKIAGLDEVIRSTDGRRGEMEALIEKAEEALRERQNQLDELNRQIATKGGEELIAVQAQIEEVKGQIEREKSSREYLAEQRAELERQQTADRAQLELHRQEREALDRRRQEAIERQAVLRKEIERVREGYQTAHDELAKLYAEQGETKKKAIEMRQELEVVKTNYNEAWQEHTRIRYAAEQSTEKAEGWKSEREGLAAELKRLEKQAEALRAEVADFAQSVQDYDRELVVLAERHEKARLEMTRLEMEVTRAKEAYNVAQYRLNASADEGGRAVQAVLDEKLRGVHGMVAQLGAVPDEYAQALEIAAGGRLRNLVVDDDGVASRCIQVLKERRAGRATFLPLNKLNPPRRLVPTGEDGFIGYAVNLVEFDPKFAPAFHHVFGDTVVVRDLDCARRHIGKYRMVTLEGELLEKTGAMTGGSAAQASTVRFTASLQKALEDAKTNLEQTLERCRQRMDTLEGIKTDTERAKEQQRYCHEQIRQKRFELEVQEQQLEATRQKFTELEGKLAVAESEQGGVEERLEAASDRMRQYEMQQFDLELAISDIEEGLENERVDALASQVNAFENTVRGLENKIQEAEFELKTIAMEAENLEKAMQRLDSELVRRARAAEDLEAKSKNQELNLAEAEKLLAMLEAQREQLHARLGQLRHDLESKTAELRAAENAVRDRQNDLQRLADGLESTRQQIAELTPQLQAMEDSFWEAGIEPPTVAPADVPTEELRRQITRLESKMRDMEPVNMLAIQDFEKESARQAELQEKVAKLHDERLQIEDRIDTISRQKKASFLLAFNQVRQNFEDIFFELAEGAGRLELEDPEDPFNGGLKILAQPKNKNMQRLDALSGGEKSLTALAFLFSFQRYMPAPFYAFDEVDAALDGVNVERLAQMVKKQTEHAQCIVISHRRPMINCSDHMIGITAKKNGPTQVLSTKWG